MCVVRTERLNSSSKSSDITGIGRNNKYIFPHLNTLPPAAAVAMVRPVESMLGSIACRVSWDRSTRRFGMQIPLIWPRVWQLSEQNERTNISNTYFKSSAFVLLVSSLLLYDRWRRHFTLSCVHQGMRGQIAVFAGKSYCVHSSKFRTSVDASLNIHHWRLFVFPALPSGFSVRWSEKKSS